MTAKAEEEMTNATIYLENAGGAGITRWRREYKMTIFSGNLSIQRPQLR